MTKNIHNLRQKIIMKNNMERNSENTDWSQLRKFYTYKIKEQTISDNDSLFFNFICIKFS